MGDVSGGLISRDFDTMTAYQRWSEAFPELAAKLPTVATSRGRHVYARTEPEAGVSAAGGKNYLDLGDGEFRCGSGAYNLLPPAVHPTGVVYTWAIPIHGKIPLLSVEATGFMRTWDTAPDDTQQTQQTQHMRSRRSTHRQTQADTAMKKKPETSFGNFRPFRIESNLLSRSRYRPDQDNDTGRYLRSAERRKAIPECAEAPAEKFRNVVKAWHGQSAGGNRHQAIRGDLARLPQHMVKGQIRVRRRRHVRCSEGGDDTRPATAGE